MGYKERHIKEILFAFIYHYMEFVHDYVSQIHVFYSIRWILIKFSFSRNKQTRLP